MPSEEDNPIEPPTKRKKTLNQKCIKCNCFLRKRASGKMKIITFDEAPNIGLVLGKEVNAGDTLCASCNNSIYLQQYRIKKAEILNENNQNEINSQGSFNNNTPSSEPSDAPASQTSTESNPTYRPPKKPKIEFVLIPLSRVVSTHRYCCVCSSKASEANLISIPMEARLQIFSKRQIFIPNGNRCCKEHIIKNRLFENELNNLRIVSNESSVPDF